MYPAARMKRDGDTFLLVWHRFALFFFVSFVMVTLFAWHLFCLIFIRLFFEILFLLHNLIAGIARPVTEQSPCHNCPPCY